MKSALIKFSKFVGWIFFVILLVTRFSNPDITNTRFILEYKGMHIALLGSWLLRLLIFRRENI
jgi:hypothetical protein